MARPRTEIDRKQFESLCALQCTLGEIAYFFGCSEDTIERWCKREYKTGFADTYKISSAGGKMSLRRLQWKAAQGGNVTMLIWLGKQWLGQTDKQESKVTESVEESKVVIYLPDDDRENREAA